MKNVAMGLFCDIINNLLIGAILLLVAELLWAFHLRSNWRLAIHAIRYISDNYPPHFNIFSQIQILFLQKYRGTRGGTIVRNLTKSLFRQSLNRDVISKISLMIENSVERKLSCAAQVD